jgi:putative peptide zinc metalloprotease protein
MSDTTHQACSEKPERVSATAIPPEGWPRLLPGAELLGQAAGSGLKEPPYLVRRRDGQVVQLSRLLYVIAAHMDGRDLSAIAETAGPALDIHITPDHVAYVAENKLAPLGLTAHRDGRTPTMEARNGFLALRCRTGVLPERTVNAIAQILKPLFVLPLVIAALAGLAACDVWLAVSGGLSSALGAVIRSPVLFLVLFAVTVLSLAFHEFGHAAACRYGGARPGRIGVGVYLVWPVFFTDVTDSYRLSKAGRIRTDLGGVYFNALWALIAGGAYLATAYRPFAVIVVTQQLMIVDQFMPWIRLDGYHIVSDLIGVSDLFTRIKPVMRSLLPGRPADRRVTELKRWARGAVTIWVLTTVTALSGMAVLVVLNASHFLERAWFSLVAQLHLIGHGAQTGDPLALTIGAVGTCMLLLPVAAMTFTYLLLCRGAGTSLAVRRGRRVDATLAASNRDEVPQCSPPRILHYRVRHGRPPVTHPTPPEGVTHA